ncbi:ribosome maturation factor RimP [Lachnoclostridium sp. Marseille-P6806]|uniref:ribosome maturation factor RimP n=1 Tax=Lachnoclostridium sp. Marseille-P6806 TaxID=2364793 RepID=UPI001030F4EC|nr:ribosome maturation factor RimP [Lachnoclostridium sp. Marseille-P6806]
MSGKAKSYAQIAEELLVPVAERFGCRVYDVDYVKEGAEYYLRCYIDKDGGVTLSDCENVNWAMSDALDERDPIPDGYILEVSSPGLGRSLTKDRHLEWSLGEEVEGKFYVPQTLEGYRDKRKEFEGVLKDWDAESVTIEMPSSEGPVHRKGQKSSRRSEAAAAERKDFRFLRSDIAVLRLKLEL